MKRIVLILLLLSPFLCFAQDFRVIDWKTNVLNVYSIAIDTFVFDAEPVDYNDIGAMNREIGNYFIDFAARCFEIIDSSATTITVVDLEHKNLAPQSNQIGRVYESIVNRDTTFHSIGGVDVSVLDDLSRWKDVARNNELFGRAIKRINGLVLPYLVGKATLTKGIYDIAFSEPMAGAYDAFVSGTNTDGAAVNVIVLNDYDLTHFTIKVTSDCTVRWHTKIITQ